MLRQLTGTVIALALGTAAQAAVKEEAVTHKDGDTLAYHPEADKQSKAQAAKFFQSVFK